MQRRSHCRCGDEHAGCVRYGLHQLTRRIILSNGDHEHFSNWRQQMTHLQVTKLYWGWLQGTNGAMGNRLPSGAS